MVRYREFDTWYRVDGPFPSRSRALVVIHGGPGSTHDYLLRLATLAGDELSVVFYDQLGNGRSTHPPDRDPSFWTVRLFLDELSTLLDELSIADDYVLLGHSWGGLLAAAYAATRPDGLRGLVVANSPASYPLWLEGVRQLRDELPRGVDATLRRHETAGTTGSDEYLSAVRVFHDRHICRVRPWPRDYVASIMEIQNDPTVYETMNGPSEFHVIGTLRDWGVVDVLPDIAVPTLVLTGRHDEATPESVQPFADLIPDVRWEVFAESSHLPHLEEPDRFDHVLTKFLAELP